MTEGEHLKLIEELQEIRRHINRLELECSQTIQPVRQWELVNQIC